MKERDSSEEEEEELNIEQIQEKEKEKVSDNEKDQNKEKEKEIKEDLIQNKENKIEKKEFEDISLIILNKENENISELLSKDINELRLSCPMCDLIPAIFVDKKSKNIYQVSSACENRHLLSNMPIKNYYQHCITLKNSSKNSINDFTCIKHYEKYNSFCKTCQKNICQECICSEHKNHFISNFYELFPNNDEISQLKKSVEQEINDVAVFLTETFDKWINDLQSKFRELIDSLKCKNKIYNLIINLYEKKEFNYQNIFNTKIISKNQIQNNPFTLEIQKLKNIVYKDEEILNNKNNYESDGDSKQKIFKEKSFQIFKILNLIDEEFHFNLFDLPSKINDIDIEEIKASPITNGFEILNPYEYGIELNYSNLNKKNSNSIKEYYEKNDISDQINLSNRKLNGNIPAGCIVNSLTVLRDFNGKVLNKFAAGLNNGKINIYCYEPKKNNIYLDFEIKEHTESITYITCLHDGRLLSCSQDGSMKLIEETNSYFLSFWRRYYVIQTLTRPQKDDFDIFKPVSVIELNNTTLISGDWKHIIIWKLKKKKISNNKEKIITNGFDAKDYNTNKYSYLYEIDYEYDISTNVTALLKIDKNSFISASYGSSTVTFYDINDKSTKTLDKIKCVDSAPQCMALIWPKQADKNSKNDKFIIIGGNNCIYLLSVKQKELIEKISIPDNNYIKCLINSGIDRISDSFICGGLFNQYSHDIVNYNIKTQLGFNELGVDEISRIKGVDKGAINSVIILKKNINNNTINKNNFIVITAGNEKCIKTYEYK